ncbi:unknown protein [Microcystis aeruginosa NIES-843]|uniref:Uncharacterized protein n=1 Tax=Microcystis aeruginosa (strain NIES-843 / IAM M-2473) TaxID=449447 RepID=B0JP28_MICAN|nr:unknown protein [Microcystis aeruginosa NIES-843]
MPSHSQQALFIENDRGNSEIFGLVGLRQKTNREKLQLQSPLGIYFEKPKIAETQIYQGKS